MADERSRRSGMPRLLWSALAIVAAGSVAAWLWRCLCLFPIHGWNEVRLAPVFQWLHFGSPYPAPEIGPATTWIYGPIPLVLLSPIVFARSAAEALMAAGIINLSLTVFTIGAVCFKAGNSLPRAPLLPGLAATLACVAIWPGASFRYFQADNVGIVCGLWSLLLLQRSSTPRGDWLAAIACAAAVLCKQTLVGLLAAELAWVYMQRGFTAARAHGARTLACVIIGFASAAISWGPQNLAYHLFSLPARLPWADSVAERLALFWPELLFHVGLPALLLVGFAGRWWTRDSRWLLPTLALLAMAPLSFAAFFKTGGSTNSLHGALLFLPFAAAQLLDGIRGQRYRVVAAFTGAALLAVSQLVSVAPGTWTPRTRHLSEGDSLARQLRGELFLPWHPLVTFFAEQRLDETDDGLFIRSLAGEAVQRKHAHLPPRFHALALRKGEMDWGIARALVPAGAQVSDYGLWTVYSWSNTPARASRAGPH